MVTRQFLASPNSFPLSVLNQSLLVLAPLSKFPPLLISRSNGIDRHLVSHLRTPSDGRSSAPKIETSPSLPEGYDRDVRISRIPGQPTRQVMRPLGPNLEFQVSLVSMGQS